MKTVKFYFAFNSPYAFLASTRIEESLADCNCALECKPIYSPSATGAPPPLSEQKLEYFFHDVGRFARAYGLELNPGPFADTGDACRGFLYAQRKGLGPDFRRAVFAARWLDAKDIGNRSVLAEIAGDCGLDPKAFLQALDDPAIEQALAQSNADAQSDGAFGVPFFVVGEERFWGNDRIEWLATHLKHG
jgi:2-hydroxychromene-2-carboxylate isomerase